MEINVRIKALFLGLIYILMLELNVFGSVDSNFLLKQDENVDVESIQGKVVDSKGEVLPGAIIVVFGTKIAVSTDVNGEFTITKKQLEKAVSVVNAASKNAKSARENAKGVRGNAKSARENAKGAREKAIGSESGGLEEVTLEITFIGMQPKKIKLPINRKAQNLKIVLQEDYSRIDEAVVTGYQTIKNRVFTGAASMVKQKDIKIEGLLDVSRMLEARVAGLSIQNVSGTFGAAPRINIRGGASILGNVQPLWVIDGAVYEDLVPISPEQLASGDAVTLISSAVAGLNASDIADIHVLKDASATSIYGARALNGVIVVTTKAGKRNTANKVSYYSEYSTRFRPNYSEFDLLNSQQTMAIYSELENKGYFSLQSSLYGRRSGVYYQMYKALTTVNPETGEFQLQNTDEAKLDFLRKREYANTDWFKTLFVNRPTMNHTVTFTGGSDKNAVYVSLGFFKDYGWTLVDNTSRLTANIKDTFYWSEKLKAELSLQGNVRDQKSPGTIPQKKNMIIGTFERDFDINPFSYAIGTSRTLRPYDENGNLDYYRNNWAPFNILNEYDNNSMKTNVLDFKFQGVLSYKPIKQLELKTLFSYRVAMTSNIHKIHENSNVIQAFRANETPFVANENIYLYHNPEDKYAPPVVALKNGGILNKKETSLKSYFARFSADYDLEKEKHEIKLFSFAEIRSTDRTVNPFQGFGIQYDRGNQIVTDPNIFKKLALQGEGYFALTDYVDRGVTFSGSGTYGYDSKYVFNTVFNVEGSNVGGLGAKSRWLPTWNIGFKWNVDQEKFFRHFSNISRLSFRTSFGLTAKMNEYAINSVAIFQNAITHRPDFSERENALKILHLENRDLTWEKMYEWDFGTEIGFYDDRIIAVLDLYKRSSFDLIDLVRTSGVGGEYYKFANFGDMKTLGMELTLNTVNIREKDFSWNTSFTLSLMDQTITKLLNTPNTFDMVSGRGKGNIVGFPRSSLFSFNFQGLTDRGLPYFDFGLYPISNDQRSSIIGADFMDSQYSKSYLIYNGSIEPKITTGLSNSFKYKGWEFSFLISAQLGQKIRLNPTFDPTFADLNVFSKEYLDRWMNKDDEFKTMIPTLPSQDLINIYGAEGIERAYNTYNYSQMRVVDGSFVRLKNIFISYALPKSILEKLRLSSAFVKLNLSNPCLIYSNKDLKGQDPEFYVSGGVSLPTPKQCTLTLNLTF